MAHAHPCNFRLSTAGRPGRILAGDANLSGLFIAKPTKRLLRVFAGTSSFAKAGRPRSAVMLHEPPAEGCLSALEDFNRLC
jgi:hypothetical protein